MYLWVSGLLLLANCESYILQKKIIIIVFLAPLFLNSLLAYESSKMRDGLGVNFISLGVFLLLPYGNVEAYLVNSLFFKCYEYEVVITLDSNTDILLLPHQLWQSQRTTPTITRTTRLTVTGSRVHYVRGTSPERVWNQS